VIAADFLHLDLHELLSQYASADQKLRVAGNLPYNIGTAIIEILLHSGLPIIDMHFMLQLEVAQRIAANPGTRQYGYLSVESQHHCDVQMGFKVSPACFAPRPQVSSAMIRLQPKSSPLPDNLEKEFEDIVKAAFSHRRKTLLNSLERNANYQNIAEELLGKAGIDGTRRAEQLSVQEYELLLHWSRQIGPEQRPK
jgi:16S rRNA (adenine1518-N6/adenine1519-N6)-dimethyltransferase